MKNCPNCQAEMEDSFNVCWNCNYSITEGRIIEFKEDIPDVRELNCLRCETPMIFQETIAFMREPSWVFSEIYLKHLSIENLLIFIFARNVGKWSFLHR